MKICVCKNINDQQLQTLMQQTKDLEQLKTISGLGTVCGKCIQYINLPKVTTHE